MNTKLETVSAGSDREIIVDVMGGVAVVTLNREAKRNALTLALWTRLGETFAALDQDCDVRAIVLTGSGASFCAGADIAEFARVRSDAAQTVEYERVYDLCCDTIAATSKPTIAAINGYCMGGGCNVAMSCDFRYAAPSATFAIPAACLSIVYGVAGTQRLRNLVGLSHAKWILYGAKTFDAERAYRIGFVDGSAPDALASAKVLAQELVDNAPLTISGAKYILDHLDDRKSTSFREAVDKLLDEAAQSDDYREGRAAFAERRRPRFRGA
jgi:enoyl-CoA hydratase/carnithine racemase